MNAILSGRLWASVLKTKVKFPLLAQLPPVAPVHTAAHELFILTLLPVQSVGQVLVK